MNEISRRPLKIFHFSFIWMFVAIAVSVIGIFAEVGAMAYLGMAAAFLGFIVNMAAMITLLMQK